LISATAIAGLLGCGMASLAAVAIAIRLRRLPVRARYAVMLAAALAVFVPIGDLPIAAYVRGVTGDLSAATLVLAGAACFTQLTGRALIGGRDKRALFWLLALAASFLYPFALGWTPFDPYALGFGSVGFITALLLIALACWWARLYLIVIVVVVATLAFLGGAYESRNLWDYLIDPLVSFYALAWLLAGVRLPNNVSLSRNSRRAA
jgi:multisubunit Na+/H+ antiporter MnhF subunit